MGKDEQKFTLSITWGWTSDFGILKRRSLVVYLICERQLRMRQP
jgi:hypothetical protein